MADQRPGLRCFAPLGLACPHLDTQPYRLLECGREAAALPLAGLLARLTRCVEAPRLRKKGSHRGHGVGLTESTEKRVWESGHWLRETARRLKALGRRASYGTQGSGCRLTTCRSSPATRHSSLQPPCLGFVRVSRIPPCDPKPSSGGGPYPEFCPAAGSRVRARKSRTGIRRPIGPSTDGSLDPSSDGLTDTCALPALLVIRLGCGVARSARTRRACRS
jgi:hypothetical protein